MPATPLPRTIYLLADTPIPDDPRVRRLGDLLHANGWDVKGIGLAGWRSPAPAWPVLALDPSAASAPLLLPAGGAARENLKSVWKVFAGFLAALLGPVAYAVRLVVPSAGAALERHRRTIRADTEWPVRQVQGIREITRRMFVWAKRAPKWARLHAGDGTDVEEDFLYRALPHLRGIGAIASAQTTPGIWVANDWRLLPIAADAAQTIGGAYVYDSHEFATEEYSERLFWRLFQRPIAAAVERRWISGAAATVSVSPGITRALTRMYGLTCPTDTVRNTPVHTQTQFRPTGKRIEVLYHGIVAKGRGLEASIRAVALLQPHFNLSIRGPSPTGYRESLEDLVAELSLGERVRILAPVPMTELVREASSFDIGLMALPGHSAHNRFALPNKIFEYMMAGLALCVSDLPSMAEVVSETGAGVTFASVTPASIAAALNNLTRDQIDAHKRAASAAAEIYNWDREGARFAALLDTLRSSANPG
jgi:glycosyltransferase involved in cell wall biosynthesis